VSFLIGHNHDPQMFSAVSMSYYSLTNWQELYLLLRVLVSDRASRRCPKLNDPSSCAHRSGLSHVSVSSRGAAVENAAKQSTKVRAIWCNSFNHISIFSPMIYYRLVLPRGGLCWTGIIVRFLNPLGRSWLR